jgi:uncharacterized protein (TIGR00369 family)
MNSMSVNHPLEHATVLDKSANPSAFRELIGLRIVEWAQDRCIVELDVRPDLLNFAGVVAGPVIGAIIDMSGNLAGCYGGVEAATAKAVTVSFAVACIGTVSTGRIRAVALKQGGGRTIFTSTVEVFAESGNVIATGLGTFRYVK